MCVWLHGDCESDGGISVDVLAVIECHISHV